MDPGAQPGFLITMGRMYEEVTGIRGDMQEFRGDMQNLSGDVRRALETGRDHEDRIRHTEQTGASKQDVRDLEEDLGPRVRALERWRWGAGGVVAVVSVGGSGLIGYLMSAR